MKLWDPIIFVEDLLYLQGTEILDMLYPFAKFFTFYWPIAIVLWAAIYIAEKTKKRLTKPS